MTYQIKRDEIICGLPAFTARKIFRGADTFNHEYIHRVAQVSLRRAKASIVDLHHAGFIEPSKHKGFYEVTPLGLSLANASARGGYLKASCDKAYAEFLERVKILNQNPNHPIYVKQVILYGSYYWDKKERYGDVDVSVDLHGRYKPPYHGAMMDKFYEDSGRDMDFYARLGYSWNNANIFLRKRSPILAISDYEQHKEWLIDKPHCEIEVPPATLLVQATLDEILKEYRQ